MGCYLHGLFSADAFRAAFLTMLGKTSTAHDYGASVEATLDALALHVETHLDMDRLLGLTGEVYPV